MITAPTTSSRGSSSASRTNPGQRGKKKDLIGPHASDRFQYARGCSGDSDGMKFMELPDRREFLEAAGSARCGPDSETGRNSHAHDDESAGSCPNPEPRDRSDDKNQFGA